MTKRTIDRAILASIVWTWIDIANRRRSSIRPILWLIVDDIEQVRKIPDTDRDQVKKTLDAMKQTDEVKQVREAIAI